MRPGTAPRGKLRSVDIPGGRALLGTAEPVFAQDGEGPLRERTLSSFRLAPTAVTNDQFADFVADTGYTTEAERTGWSFVYRGALAAALTETEADTGDRYAWFNVGTNYAGLGEYDEAARLQAEGLRVAQEHNLLVPLQNNYFWYGLTLAGFKDALRELTSSRVG